MLRFNIFLFLSLVHGGLSQWSKWKDCDKPCGGGWIKRHRACDNPVPKNNGRFCLGSLEEKVECNVHFCPGMSNLQSMNHLIQRCMWTLVNLLTSSLTSSCNYISIFHLWLQSLDPNTIYQVLAPGHHWNTEKVPHKFLE